jgi:hypothetical protein
MTDDLNREIAEKLTWDELRLLEDLEAAFGHNAIPEQPGRRGNEIFSKLASKLKGTICSNVKIRTMAQSTNPDDSVWLAAALLDCILGYKFNVSPTTLCALLIRRGINTLCSDIRI